MGSIRFREIEKDGQVVIEEIHKVVVHLFSVGDAEDPDLYAAQPLYDWEKSDQGQFIMKNSISQPSWERMIDHLTWEYKYAIIAELEKKKLSEYYLKFEKKYA